MQQVRKGPATAPDERRGSQGLATRCKKPVLEASAKPAAPNASGKANSKELILQEFAEFQVIRFLNCYILPKSIRSINSFGTNDLKSSTKTIFLLFLYLFWISQNASSTLLTIVNIIIQIIVCQSISTECLRTSTECLQGREEYRKISVVHEKMRSNGGWRNATK
ncbi:hypothetical protein BHK98_09555 [Hornefia porci]|uniref:Uncharacterized protein n=1 Tax=Hornefia porci TaxID=2652292 RepID=A0A1Q9JJA5_9FIRM|nr:hypothetical protein BHK98_09555 [Hornefia porci]